MGSAKDPRRPDTQAEGALSFTEPTLRTSGFGGRVLAAARRAACRRTVCVKAVSASAGEESSNRSSSPTESIGDHRRKCQKTARNTFSAGS